MCQIDNCGVTISGNHAANFERHIERVHADEHKLLRKDKTIVVENKKKVHLLI